MTMERSANAKPRMVLVGDVATETADPAAIFDLLAPYTSQSAIAFANCEWPLADRGAPWPGKAGRVVKSRPDLIGTYTIPGFNVVCLANNHLMNFGPEGMMQTIEVLDRAGIAHCGGGRNLEEAHRPAIVTWRGRRYAFLSYTSVFTPGMEAAEDRTGMAVIRIECNYRIPNRLHEVPGSPLVCETKARPAYLARMKQDIASARTDADDVIVSMHWGVSMGHQHLIGYQIDVGHAAIDAGADLVVGHHPHTIQPVEIYKGKTIAYSLAQCGFDMKSHHFTDESIALEMELTDRGFGRTRVRPLADSIHRPRVVDLKEGASTIEWLRRMSRPLGTVFTDDGDAVVASHDASLVPQERHYSEA
jgi:poly-gamma-glutamate capsule biosynthesis protein CapA/YwtB (metallophosphatase superfamily)